MTNEERKVLELALDWIEKQPEETPDSKYDVDTRYVVIREIEAELANPEQCEYPRCACDNKESCKQKAQPEQWGASAVTHPEYVAEQKAKTQELRSMLAQPEQEPVAYCWKSLSTGDLFDFVENKNGDALKEQDEDFPTSNLILLYTTPPQRKPLTDEEIAEMWLEILGSTPPSGIHEDGLQPWRFARAIEAAHGIKE